MTSREVKQKIVQGGVESSLTPGNQSPHRRGTLQTNAALSAWETPGNTNQVIYTTISFPHPTIDPTRSPSTVRFWDIFFSVVFFALRTLVRTTESKYRGVAIYASRVTPTHRTYYFRPFLGPFSGDVLGP